MPTVFETIALSRRRVLALDAQMTQLLLDQYAVAWRAVERDLAVIDGQINAALARGDEVSESWLRRQAWWRQTQASIEAQMQRFALNAAGTLTTAQSGAVRIAQTVGLDFRAAIEMPFTGRVNANAFERWVSAQQPDSPIRGVIDRYGTRVSESITRNITEGLGTGKGTKAMTRQIVAEVGASASEARVSTLVRTETLRSYRGALEDDLTPLQDEGIITGYRWLCAKSARTCIACIARDGLFFPQYPTGWHVACRCVARPVVDPSIIPPGRPRETGAEWFAKQDAATQAKMLGSKGRIDAYRDGAPLSEFVGVRESSTWGPAVFIRPAPAR